MATTTENSNTMSKKTSVYINGKKAVITYKPSNHWKYNQPPAMKEQSDAKFNHKHDTRGAKRYNLNKNKSRTKDKSAKTTRTSQRPTRHTLKKFDSSKGYPGEGPGTYMRCNKTGCRRHYHKLSGAARRAAHKSDPCKTTADAYVLCRGGFCVKPHCHKAQYVVKTYKSTDLTGVEHQFPADTKSASVPQPPSSTSRSSTSGGDTTSTTSPSSSEPSSASSSDDMSGFYAIATRELPKQRVKPAPVTKPVVSKALVVPPPPSSDTKHELTLATEEITIFTQTRHNRGDWLTYLNPCSKGDTSRIAFHNFQGDRRANVSQPFVHFFTTIAVSDDYMRAFPHKYLGTIYKDLYAQGTRDDKLWRRSYFTADGKARPEQVAYMRDYCTREFKKLIFDPVILADTVKALHNFFYALHLYTNETIPSYQNQINCGGPLSSITATPWGSAGCILSMFHAIATSPSLLTALSIVGVPILLREICYSRGNPRRPTITELFSGGHSLIKG